MIALGTGSKFTGWVIVVISRCVVDDGRGAHMYSCQAAAHGGSGGGGMGGALCGRLPSAPHGDAALRIQVSTLLLTPALIPSHTLNDNHNDYMLRTGINCCIDIGAMC